MAVIPFQRGPSRPPSMPAIGGAPRIDGTAPPQHPVVGKVARLALISEIGTEFIDKMVSAMLDELEA